MSERIERVALLVHSSDDGDALLECVRAALAQGVPGLHVVVLDDGSADGSLGRVARTFDPHLRVVGQSRRGGGALMAGGVALTTAPWLLFLPGALRLPPRWVEEVLRRVAREGDVDAVLAPLPPHAAREDGGALLESLLLDEPFAIGPTLVRRAALAEIGGLDAILRDAWLLDLWLRLLPRSRSLIAPLDAAPAERALDADRQAARRAEASFVRARALRRLDPGAGSGGGDGARRAEDCLALAGRVVERGDAALRPFALDLACRARGATAAPAPTGLRLLLPGISAPPAVARPPARTVVDATPLRVALEVESLGVGGLERLVADLAIGLRREGITPAVVCTRAGGSEAERLLRDGIEVRILTEEHPAPILADWLETRGIRVLHSHFSFLGAPVAAASGIPVVSTLHNAYAWMAAGPSGEMRLLDGFVSAYTAVSESVASFCARRFGIDRERIRVIRNALSVDHRGLELDRATARSRLAVPAGEEVVLQVGRIDPIKCQLALVDAMAVLAPLRPRLRAWIAGAVGDPEYAARVRERIHALGLADRITLLGERSDVAVLLRAADVFALPSVLEGLSLAAIEALCAGLPLVLTRTGDADFLLGEGAEPQPGILVDGPAIDPLGIDGPTLASVASVAHPAHAAALAEALARVLDDLPLRREAAYGRGRDLAAALSPERMVSEYAAVLRRTAAVGAREMLARARARSAALGEHLAEARRTTHARRERALQHARAVSLAAAAGAGLQGANWHVGHAVRELELARTALEQGAAVENRALDRLRLGRRARLALERWWRLRPGRT